MMTVFPLTSAAALHIFVLNISNMATAVNSADSDLLCSHMGSIGHFSDFVLDPTGQSVVNLFWTFAFTRTAHPGNEVSS